MLYETGHREWDIPGLRQLLTDISPGTRSSTAFGWSMIFRSRASSPAAQCPENHRRGDHNRNLILLAIEDVTQSPPAEDGPR